jgi:hypothetical protein
MTKQELEAIWIPRIGEKGTAEMWRYRKIGIFGFTAGLFAAGAGLLIGTGVLHDVIGGVLAAMAAAYLVIFIRAQVRIAAALSEWYGVKIRGIPVMNPKRFDEWRQARGLHHPGEQVVSGQQAQSSEDAPRQSH